MSDIDPPPPPGDSGKSGTKGSGNIAFENEGGVLVVTINRPKKKNALTLDMYAQLSETLRDPDPDIRVIVIAGAGETFCAGNDVLDFVQAARGVPGEHTVGPQARFLEALVHSHRPLVAAVHGAAIGVGATMLLHCDLVYASPTARLQMPFVELGLVPEAASSLLLPERVGLAVASEMLLLGAPLGAERALELRLINGIVPAGELLDVARERAKALAAKPPEALRATRELLRGKERARITARLQLEVERFAERLASSEAQQAFMAFLQRKPAT